MTVSDAASPQTLCGTADIGDRLYALSGCNGCYEPRFAPIGMAIHTRRPRDADRPSTWTSSRRGALSSRRCRSPPPLRREAERRSTEVATNITQSRSRAPLTDRTFSARPAGAGIARRWRSRVRPEREQHQRLRRWRSFRSTSSSAASCGGCGKGIRSRERCAEFASSRSIQVEYQGRRRDIPPHEVRNNECTGDVFATSRQVRDRARLLRARRAIRSPRNVPPCASHRGSTINRSRQRRRAADAGQAVPVRLVEAIQTRAGRVARTPTILPRERPRSLRPFDALSSRPSAPTSASRAAYCPRASRSS